MTQIVTERVLIVDDDPQKCDRLRRFFGTNGVSEDDIYIAPDASSARIALRDRPFDILLLDVLLPPRQGGRPAGDVSVDLLRQMIEDRTSPAPGHIVAITADMSALAEHELEFRQLTTLVLHVGPEADGWTKSLESLLGMVRAAKAARSKFDYHVCFQTALRTPELSALLGVIPCDWEPERALCRGILYRSGVLETQSGNLRVIAAHSQAMGMLSASHLATALLQAFRPRVLAMTGICGGLLDTELGDVVVAERSWDWQCGKWDEAGVLQIAPDQREGSPELVAVARGTENAVARFYENYAGPKPSRAPAVRVGPMVSGSAVVANRNFHEVLRRQHRKTLAIDMECYGAYFAAAMAEEPRPEVVCIKSVSDLADRRKGDDYQEFCSSVSAFAAAEALSEYFRAPVRPRHTP